MALPALVADYLFIGPLMQQRLQALIPDVPVDLVERPEQVLAADRRARVLMVMWAGDRFPVPDPNKTTSSQLMYQRWLVIAGINNVGAQGDARAAAAGPLLSQVHQAVAGWKPEGAVRSFQRVNSPLGPNFTASKAVLPLGFEISLSL